MFWDTTDFWTDSSKTKKIKAYRRKSNYYEAKTDDLQELVDEIDRLLNTAQTGYGMVRGAISTSVENVTKYKFYELETIVFRKAQENIEKLSTKKAAVNTQKNRAYSLYRKYYNLARREDD